MFLLSWLGHWETRATEKSKDATEDSKRWIGWKGRVLEFPSFSNMFSGLEVNETALEGRYFRYYGAALLHSSLGHPGADLQSEAQLSLG